jgi:fatty-acid desaturase
MLTTIMIATTIIVIVVMTLRCAKHRTFDIQRYAGQAIRRTVLFVEQVSSAERSLGKAVASA